MTIKEAIRKMMDFYNSVEAVYADLPEEVEVTNDVKAAFQTCLIEAGDAFSELEKMQIVGVDCKHCKFSGLCTNACTECMFDWLAPADQKRPLNYEPV